MSTGRFPFRYRVRRADKRTYWQFGTAEEAIKYLLPKDRFVPLSDAAYLCKIEPDGSEGEVLGWFRPLDGGGVTYAPVASEAMAS